jgi:hypothetical protein
MRHSTNGGGHVDTKGHSVFVCLSPDEPMPDELEAPVSLLDTVIRCLEWAIKIAAVFLLGGLVAGLLFQLFVGVMK